jgi:hypothetical protein
LVEERATYSLDLGLAFEAVTLGTADHKRAVEKFVTKAGQGTKPALRI